MNDTLTQTVEVYNYLQTDSALDHAGHIAPAKATMAVILALGAEPLLGTAEAIDPAQLDGSGHYRRIATGWGVLD